MNSSRVSLTAPDCRNTQHATRSSWEQRTLETFINVPTNGPTNGLRPAGHAGRFIKILTAEDRIVVERPE